mmetsp:Transcript_8271/g.16103  ORF Transcript_8271/g.16103 Transcript_8271/m.16103 type:complete len:91 (-) Transcript_8271:261-533(-)
MGTEKQLASNDVSRSAEECADTSRRHDDRKEKVLVERYLKRDAPIATFEAGGRKRGGGLYSFSHALSVSHAGRQTGSKQASKGLAPCMES